MSFLGRRTVDSRVKQEGKAAVSDPGSKDPETITWAWQLRSNDFQPLSLRTKYTQRVDKDANKEVRIYFFNCSFSKPS